MKCPFCSQDNLIGAQFCDNCGASLKQSSRSQTYTAAARLEPAPPPTPIFPSRSNFVPASAAAPAPAVPAYAAAPAPAAPAYAAAPAPAVPAYAAAPASAVPAYAAAPAPAASAYAAAPASAVSYAYLTDSDSGQVFRLSSDRVLLGRGPGQPEDGFKLDLEGLRGGATVSKRHALLRHDSTGVFIEDVGSGNGTFINGERLPKGVECGLSSGTQLRLGAALLTFAIINNKK